MITYTKLTNIQKLPENISKQQFIDFLHHHLGQYGDSKKDIEKALDYASSKKEGKGGFILIAHEKDSLVGAVIINNSGMSGYIPNHFLVYIVVHENYRGKGLGKQLLQKTIDECEGDIALHVEYDNIPATQLYENMGFHSKYAEMRYKQKKD